jgi:subtilisin family serine protease
VEDITDQYTVKVGGAEIGGMARREKPMPTRPASGKHHYLLQFAGPIKVEWLRRIRAAGAEPRVPYQNFTYVVRLDPQTMKKTSELPFVRWIREFPHRARIATALREKGKRHPAAVALPRNRLLSNVVTVEFFGPEDLRKGISQIKRSKGVVLNKEATSTVLSVEVPGSAARQKKVIAAISAIHGVRSIRERSIKRTSNDVSAVIMGTAASMGSSGLGLSGKGEIVGICDTGLDTGNPATIHPDFAARIAAIKSYPITSDYSPYISNPGGNDGPADLDSGHGTHVSGSVLGDGSASASLPGQARPIRGLAYRAKLAFQAVEQELKWKNPADAQTHGRYLLAGIPNDIRQIFRDAYQNGVRIHSNSWGGGDPGAYDSQCEQLDQFVWSHKDFCIVVAAGNDGSDSDGDGLINPMSVTSPGTAKNCITVGACENLRPSFNGEKYGTWWPHDYPVAPYKSDPMADDPQEVVAFSSRGPTLDKRVKPDVVAPGTFILSTRSRQIAANNFGWASFPKSRLYFYMGGTSMATPLTSGAVALVREYLRTVRKTPNPSAALLKAMMIAGARQLPGIKSGVCDNNQGFGRVDLDSALTPPSPATVTFRDVSPGVRTGEIFKVDLTVKSVRAPLRIVLAYSDYPGRSLVNNLNLIVQSPSGRVYAGNAGPGPDNQNNVEVVNVTKPKAGTWQIQVVGSNVPHGPQAFALVCKAHQ